MADILNARAVKKYGEFVGAIDFTTEQFPQVRKLIERMKPTNVPAGSWRVARPDELRAMLKKALRSLEALKEQAQKYEAELKSREWKV
ncbi:hypothetical protein Q5530_15665 [Saccharothrix sp. BKS2]|uniref:hypothetical protein n=1 Tax=Saccharothrix sp. BKS2 TaxID=3064400 RepID=UPI0039EA8A98